MTVLWVGEEKGNGKGNSRVLRSAQRLSDLSRVKWVMEKTAAGRLGKRLIVFRFPTTPAATAVGGI